MKKSLVAAILASLTMGIAVPAFAATTDDVNFSGQFRARYTNDANTEDDTDYRLRLVLNKEVAPNLDLKARFAKETNIGPGAATNDKADLDQLSLKYAFADGKTTAIMGKDDVFLGAGLIMDNYFENIQVSTMVDDVNLVAFTGRNSGIDLSGISAQGTSGKLTLGASYLNNSDNAAKNWAVNAGYTFDNASVTAEYAKNTKADDDNKAYMISATFGSLAKKGDTNFGLGYTYIGANANIDNTTLDMPSLSDIKGFTASVNTKLADNVTLTVEQQINKTISTDEENNRTRAQVVVTF